MNKSNACNALAALADEIASTSLDATPKSFILALGERAAGIDLGLEGYIDLMRGGENSLPGRGFRGEFDDSTDWQVRHFAGAAAATALFGADATRWLTANVLRDAPGTADGRLTEAAIEFSTLLLNGELPLEDASQWMLEKLCGEE
jgi:hypothetical protein